MAKKQLLIEQTKFRGGLQNIGAMVFDCSEASYDRVVELREIISKNNFSQNIILTHRLEADYLKDILYKK
jgi:hypothetical protein